ncbi:MAG TPA: IS6 family transposase, partial [Geobacteraceae bacterium]|nr:IS6 family transposase [Geobacteraceae bacterium]
RKGRKYPVGNSWRMDETYIKINGQWKYLYRAVDKAGQTIDFLLTAHRNKKAALRFFKKAVRQHGLPAKVTIDKSGANTAALDALIGETETTIEIRQSKYLNNLVEQDHRAVKRIVRPMLGFHSFQSARVTLSGIELMHMIKKGQRIAAGGQKWSAAGQFYSLAA